MSNTEGATLAMNLLQSGYVQYDETLARSVSTNDTIHTHSNTPTHQDICYLVHASVFAKEHPYRIRAAATLRAWFDDHSED